MTSYRHECEISEDLCCSATRIVLALQSSVGDPVREWCSRVGARLVNLDRGPRGHQLNNSAGRGVWQANAAMTRSRSEERGAVRSVERHASISPIKVRERVGVRGEGHDHWPEEPCWVGLGHSLADREAADGGWVRGLPDDDPPRLLKLARAQKVEAAGGQIHPYAPRIRVNAECGGRKPSGATVRTIGEEDPKPQTPVQGALSAENEKHLGSSGIWCVRLNQRPRLRCEPWRETRARRNDQAGTPRSSRTRRERRGSPLVVGGTTDRLRGRGEGWGPSHHQDPRCERRETTLADGHYPVTPPARVAFGVGRLTVPVVDPTTGAVLSASAVASFRYAPAGAPEESRTSTLT